VDGPGVSLPQRARSALAVEARGEGREPSAGPEPTNC
jgi:hypothetical protein